LEFDLRNEDVLKDLEKNGLEIEVGQVAKLTLHQNLSTGYGWKINEDAAGDLFSI